MTGRKISIRAAAAVAVGFAVVTMAAPLEAQPRTPVDLSKLGPQVGEQVPDFSLPDQHGQVWTRDSIIGPDGAMLVFVRSADW